MPNMRLKFTLLDETDSILYVEFASSKITDYTRALEKLLKVIEISEYYGGGPVQTEENIEPEINEDYPFTAACFLEFETRIELREFLKGIDLRNLD